MSAKRQATDPTWDRQLNPEFPASKAFKKLSVDARLVFFALVHEPRLAAPGVLEGALDVPGLSAERVERGLQELERRRFIGIRRVLTLSAGVLR